MYLSTATVMAVLGLRAALSACGSTPHEGHSQHLGGLDELRALAVASILLGLGLSVHAGRHHDLNDT